MMCWLRLMSNVRQCSMQSKKCCVVVCADTKTLHRIKKKPLLQSNEASIWGIQMKECEITVDHDMVGFWVTIAIVLAILKLMTPLSFSWWWVGLAISMPGMIVVGVVVVMAVIVGSQWAFYNVRVKIESKIRQTWNYRKYRDKGVDTSNH